MEVCDIVSVAGDNRVMGRENISIFFSVMIRVEKIDKKPRKIYRCFKISQDFRKKIYKLKDRLNVLNVLISITTHVVVETTTINKNPGLKLLTTLLSGDVATKTVVLVAFLITTDVKDLAPWRRPELADVVGRLGGDGRGRAHQGRDLKSHVVGYR